MTGQARPQPGIDPDRVTTLIRAVAAQYILPYFRNLKSSDISFKSGDDPVTIADQMAEKELSARLLELLPGSKVVGEEAFAGNPGILSQFSGEKPVWIIDPIDGTRNFVKGSHRYGVIVALAKRNQVIAGWIYDPTSDEVLTAEKGSGAWFKGQRLKVLPPKPLAEMTGFIGDSLVALYKKQLEFKNIKPMFKPMSVGSHEYPQLVLNRPHFAENAPQAHFRASLYYSTPWDDAAGVLIEQEAGGYAAFWTGEDYCPSVIHKGLALAPDKESWCALRAWCQTFADLTPAFGQWGSL